MEVTLSVRLPQRLHEQLQEQADKEDRALASLIRVALRAYLSAVSE